jgi:methyl-accepting chemotaxis protein
MKLLTKFNLILIVLFGACGLVIADVAYNFLINNARREVMEEAELMMTNAKSIRDYTADEITPLLEQSSKRDGTFQPETVPAFSALATFNHIHAKYPDYEYHEATLNPTNPAHHALDWEADVINYLRDHRDKQQVTGERASASGPTLYLATPIAADATCLVCHSTPAVAPAAMIAKYGSKHGFGWKQGAVVAAQIVSVPMSLPIQIANEAFHRLLLYLIVAVVATMIALDIGVYCIVIRPLKLVSETANRVSKGEKDVPVLPVKGRDEIATVTASFNRMRVSLEKAFKLLQ